MLGKRKHSLSSFSGGIICTVFVCLFVQQYDLLWFLPSAGFSLFIYLPRV